MDLAPSQAFATEGATLAVHARSGSRPSQGRAQVSGDHGRQLIIDQLVVWAVASSLFSLIFLGDPSEDRWRRHPFFTLLDVFGVALVSLTAISALKAVRSGHRVPSTPIARGAVALLVAMFATFLVHPSVMGVATLFHFAIAVSIASQLERRTHLLRPVILTAMSVAVFESIVCAGQMFAGRALGISALGEVGDPFIAIGSVGRIPAGTMFHPYPLTGFCLIAYALAIVGVHLKLVTPAYAMFTAVGCGGMVGFTASVSAAIASSLVAACVVASAAVTLITKRGDWRVLLLVLAFAVGLAGGTSASWASWNWKGERTASSVEQASNGRLGMIRQAEAMIKRWPLTGVGPGRYMAARDAHPEIAAIATTAQPVHNYPMLIVVETGVLGALALIYLGAQTLRALRKNWAPVVVVLASISGNLMFDHYLWLFSAGAIQVGMALGTIGAIGAVATRSRQTAAGRDSVGQDRAGDETAGRERYAEVV